MSCERTCVWRQFSEDNNVKIESLCQGIIYILSSKGKIKSAKHLILGLSIKSLISNKKIVTVLNKYGHSIAYSTVEELETEMTYTAYETNNLLPPGIKIQKELSTNVA